MTSDCDGGMVIIILKSITGYKVSNTLKFCSAILSIISGIFLIYMLLYQSLDYWSYWSGSESMEAIDTAFDPDLFHPEVFIPTGILLLLTGSVLLYVLRWQVRYRSENKRIDFLSFWMAICNVILFLVFFLGFIVVHELYGRYSVFNPLFGIVMTLVFIIVSGYVLILLHRIQNHKFSRSSGEPPPHQKRSPDKVKLIRKIPFGHLIGIPIFLGLLLLGFQSKEVWIFIAMTVIGISFWINLYFFINKINQVDFYWFWIYICVMVFIFMLFVVGALGSSMTVILLSIMVGLLLLFNLISASCNLFLYADKAKNDNEINDASRRKPAKEIKQSQRLLSPQVLNYRIITAFLLGIALIYLSMFFIMYRNVPSTSYYIYWEYNDRSLQYSDNPEKIALPGVNVSYNLILESKRGVVTSKLVVVANDDEVEGNWSVNPKEVTLKPNERKTINFTNYVPRNAETWEKHYYEFFLIHIEEDGPKGETPRSYRCTTSITNDTHVYNVYHLEAKKSSPPMYSDGTSSSKLYSTMFELSFLTYFTWISTSGIFVWNRRRNEGEEGFLLKPPPRYP